MKKFISVCKNVIAGNNKTIREGRADPLQPPIRIQNGKSGDKVTCNHAVLKDKSGNIVGRIHYRADKALISCGAKVVIEYDGDIEVVE